MPNGTVRNYVKKNPGANRIGLVSLFPTIRLGQYRYPLKLLDVAEGLSYLHMSHTIHGDLKGAGALLAMLNAIANPWIAQYYR
jgi:hypothetical protein